MKFLINIRILVLGLLLAVLFIPFLSIPIASQSSTTTTMTIAQPSSQGQCTMLTLPFTARAGEQIIGTYGSDVSINFYILSQNDLNAIQNCRLNPSVRPMFIEEKSVGHNNPYRSLSFPATGTYYFVFLFVRGPTQLTKGYATVELSFSSSVVIMTAAGSGAVTPIASTTIPLTSTPTVTSVALSPTSTLPTTISAASTSNPLPPTSTTSVMTESSSASNLSIGVTMPLTNVLLVIGVVVIAAGGLVGVMKFRNQKRRILSNYLARVDSTFNEFAVDREDCRTRLEGLKNDVIEMLNKGKIDEGHFLMLDEKISEYLKELTQATPKYKRASGSDKSAGTRKIDESTQTGEVKYCSSCGSKLLSDQKVCRKCGTTQ